MFSLSIGKITVKKWISFCHSKASSNRQKMLIWWKHINCRVKCGLLPFAGVFPQKEAYNKNCGYLEMTLPVVWGWFPNMQKPVHWSEISKYMKTPALGCYFLLKLILFQRRITPVDECQVLVRLTPLQRCFS